jgi:hypothetical protein
VTTPFNRTILGVGGYSRWRFADGTGHWIGRDSRFPRQVNSPSCSPQRLHHDFLGRIWTGFSYARGVAQEREVIEAGVVIGWVGGPVEPRNPLHAGQPRWYARSNPVADGVRLPERTMWHDTEEAAVGSLRALTSRLRSTQKLRRADLVRR